ncbi:hypothetical protein I6N90_23200 [Paenibacillus sp. GSMTC-2017]|uniref:hypothetical protein n=1 Tax=Paenibacillus sp. GSMTC-2017 TaxID=2794350 RepID=UPI0018D69EF7|nr:hypothetical protein [Paenibacillus sp. GSMTC-2017]MBH5320706.1 hypothetical protein [Paenibacillus sp. GSMTC-2017]
MVVWLFVAYMLLSAILLYLRYGHSYPQLLIRLVIVTVFPIIGWLFPIFWPKRLYVNAGEDFHDYITKQQEEHKVRHVGIYSVLEAEKELNVIPIEDALVVSEHQTRRRVMIDVLKQDSIHYLEILQTAVSNEDTETSHYAVSAIMEVKRKLLIAIQELSVQYEQHKKDEYVVHNYSLVLKGFLRSGFLDERTITKYQYTYINVLETLIELSDEAEWAYQDKVETELKLELYAVAESTSIRYLEQYPHSEEAYLCLLKVYFTTRSALRLHQTLDQLKRSPIRLSNQALTLVRFWSEGASV